MRAEHGFELDEVDITGVPELEERYREWLPVVEIDGGRAFVYHLDEAAFARKLGAQSRADDGPAQVPKRAGTMAARCYKLRRQGVVVTDRLTVGVAAS